jgi:hypothetical protein
MKFKKLIAREGLIILAILTISAICGEWSYNHFWTKVAPNIEKPLNYVPTLGSCTLDWLKILFGFYLFYWLVHFVQWAIRTLREK